ncbi:iron-containing alcohol dehydrogenase [Virgibacillus dokdonensis]|uniref:1,3-propanediol dehydrogenase n=2 Tax=Virgibacillus TaxID=84406 RepID=A0A2K9J808_9BACI|nr:1,3-propanediol dehydrogenase [Virgibacillus dokdonensis]
MFYTLYCRMYQQKMKIASKWIHWRTPILIKGENSLQQLPKVLEQNKQTRVLIVTDKGLSESGLLDTLCADLQCANIDYAIYDKTVPNPTVRNIEEALTLFCDQQCKAMIALGGGSVIDCAKVVGARFAYPNKSISKMKGQLKVRKETPTLYAVPTTAGSGSEATLAAVVSNPATSEKYAINSPVLTPNYALHDPKLLVNLPPFMTATTGMDALTHAIEAFIGKSNTQKTRDWSKQAVVLIFGNLEQSYIEPEDLTARASMQKASYLAGKAFTRAYVGYVHAIAHTFGGFYQVPHGYANAIILPYVLEFYDDVVYDLLAELADTVQPINQFSSNKEKALWMIREIKRMNKAMGIPEKIATIDKGVIPKMVERALKEANPLYPVPKILTKQDLYHLYYQITE